jgi:hypothetical protein
MARFDTDHILSVIAWDALQDHETNRQVIEALEGFRLGNQEAVVATVLEVVLRQMTQSQHGRDLVVGLVDRFKEEALARSLSEIELMAAGLDPEEIEYTLRNYPEEFTPEGIARRRPTRQELDEGGAI